MNSSHSDEGGRLLVVLSGCICWTIITKEENLLIQMFQISGRCVDWRVQRSANATKRFYENDRLTWSESITDGFYDPGAGRELIPLSQYPDDILSSDHLDNGQREVIIIDSTVDIALQRSAKMLRCMNGITNPEMRISLVKKAVGMLFNGEQGNITAKNHKAILGKPVKRYLGEIKHGVCRHYSIATKYFCDLIGIPAWLQRGTHIDERHSWVVCSLSSNFILVDMALEDPSQGSVWPDRKYSPMMPKQPPQCSSLILPNVFPNEEVGGFFSLPNGMTRITGVQGGTCIEYIIGELNSSIARQLLWNPCRYTIDILDVSEEDGVITIANFATTVEQWIYHRMGTVFDATKMVKIVGMVLVQLHSSGIHHGDIGTHSIAAFASPLYPGDIHSLKVLFPTTARRHDGSPSADWIYLRKILLVLAPTAKKIPILLQLAAEGDIQPFLQWIDNTERRS